MTVQDYKKRFSSRFIATDAALMAQTIVEADYYYASIKYDGHLGLLNISKVKVSLTGVDAKERNIPVILKAAENFKDDMLLAGEICVFKDGGKAYPAFLEGRTSGDKYLLMIQLSNMELKGIL